MTLTAAQPTIQPRVLLAALAIIAVWPTAFSFIKIGLEYFSPLGLMTFRMLCGMAAMLAYVLVRRYPLPRGRDLLALAVSGLCGVGLYSYFINLACQTITAGETAFLIALNPLFVALAGWWFYQEKIGYKTLTGMAISLAGVGLITLSSHGIRLELGTLYGVMSGLVFAVYIVVQKPLFSRYPMDLIGAYSAIFGGAFFLPFVPSVGHELFAELPVKAYLTFIYLGLVSTAAGFLVWSYVLKHVSRMQAASIVYILPFSAAVNAMWIIHEYMAPIAWVGGVLIIIGVAIVNIRRSAKLAAKGEVEEESLIARE